MCKSPPLWATGKQLYSPLNMQIANANTQSWEDFPLDTRIGWEMEIQILMFKHTSRRGLLRAQAFAFALSSSVLKLLNRKLFEGKPLRASWFSLPFIVEDRSALPGGYHAASHPVSQNSFPAFGYFWTETDSPYRGEGTPKLNLEKFWSNISSSYSNFILKVSFFFFFFLCVCVCVSGKMLAEEPSWLVMHFFTEG